LIRASANLSLLHFALNDGRGTRRSPRFSEKLNIIKLFENVEQRYKADVVVLKMSKEIRHRVHSLERRKGGEAGQNDKECDATIDHSIRSVGFKSKIVFRTVFR